MYLTKHFKSFLIFVIFTTVATKNLIAQPPAGYYNSASGLNCSGLKTALSTITSSGTFGTYGDLWTRYLTSDIKPRTVGSGSANVIFDIYSWNPLGVDPYQFTPTTNQCGTYNSEADCYNREHSVPQSWFNGNTSVPGPTTDFIHIFPTDGFVNGKRGNEIYGEVATASWTALNGAKLGTSSFAGLTGTVFEPIDSVKGDLARAFLYFVTRFQSNIPGWSSNANATQSFDNSTFPSVKIAYLKLMLKWHNLDPISYREQLRNNAAFVHQGNRNPFVDSVQFISRVWNSTCPGLGALPFYNLLLSGKLNDTKINLTWEVDDENQVKQYEVERSFNGTEYLAIANVFAAGKSSYSLSDGVENINGRRVYYRIKKVSNDGKFIYSEVFTIHIPLNIKFSIYPNPVKNILSLKLNTNERFALVSISDYTGRNVLTQKNNINNKLIQVPVNNLNNGTYIVKLSINGESYSSIFIVNK